MNELNHLKILVTLDFTISLFFTIKLLFKQSLKVQENSVKVERKKILISDLARYDTFTL